MSVTFPNLSKYPSDKYHIETLAYDPSIRTQAEDGVVMSRARFTTTKKRWEITYDNLTETDKGLLDTMQGDAMVGGDTITWTNPKDDIEYIVRLAEPIEFSMKVEDVSLWETTIIFIEA